jgi:hypothetical protein
VEGGRRRGRRIAAAEINPRRDSLALFGRAGAVPLRRAVRVRAGKGRRHGQWRCPCQCGAWACPLHSGFRGHAHGMLRQALS